MLSADSARRSSPRKATLKRSLEGPALPTPHTRSRRGNEVEAPNLSAALMAEDMEDDNITNGEWVDLDIEVALDSGACDHVMDVESDVPGYEIRDSASSRRGGCSIVGNGERVSNEGQAILNLETGGGLGQSSEIQQFRGVRL